MEKVVNSVKQIVDECNNMLQLASSTEFIDVRSLAKTLEEQCTELSALFDNEPDNTDSIRRKKSEVEHTATRFEFLLYVRQKDYSDRYNLRQFAKRMYDDTRTRLLTLSSNGGSKEDVAEWGDKTKWALKFYERSLHIVFETDEDDEKRIKDIVESLKREVG